MTLSNKENLTAKTDLPEKILTEIKDMKEALINHIEMTEEYSA
jgi:hypothetical protein